MKKMFLFLSVFLMVCCSSSNGTDDDTNNNTEAKMLSFRIGTERATINEQTRTATITVPAGTGLTEVTPIISVSQGASYTPTGKINLIIPVEFTVTSGNGSNIRKYTVTANSSYIELTSNEVFFSPVGTLTNVIVPNVPGDPMNQDKFFSHTKEWKNETDTLVWPIEVRTAGTLNITPVLGVPAAHNGSRIELSIGEQKQSIILAHTGDYTAYGDQSPASFNISSPGRYMVNMKIESKNSSGEVAYVKGIKIDGTAAKGLTPIKLRWRPAAVHTSWGSKNNPPRIIMSVHENTITTTGIDAYFPITTPFGYYGSTWTAATRQFGGINFSLWSFGANEAPPPVEQFSHLIAVGEGMYIDGFNHEGTGVKPRGDNPYADITGVNTQVLAVKKVPGNPYDVYYSYYLDLATRKWKLFGCGKKYNDKALQYLTVGAFVEQPGVAEKRRCGHTMREVTFSGWFMDDTENWHPMDRMTPTGNIEEFSYKNWGITQDGKFFLQMGGTDRIPDQRPGAFTLSGTPAGLPDYLQGDNLADLFKMPAEIEMEPASVITSNSADVSFNIPDTGTDPVVKLYWGKTDGLTFIPENRGNGGVVKWDFNIALPVTGNGIITHTIDNLDPGTKYYYRLQIINKEGETWSFDTQTFTTNN